MTMSETKANDTMKKTKNTMNAASKCVSLAPRLSRAKPHAYARHQESRKRLNKTLCASRTQARLVGLAAACHSFERRDNALK